MKPKNPALSVLVNDAQTFLLRYVAFTTNDLAFVASLWAIATYLWPHFDAFPYLVITSDTKRSGKSRFAELLSFMSSNPRSMGGMTPATVFRSIRDENPTLFMDEAETLSSEAASMMRAILNVGYRKGTVIPRMGKQGVEEWPAYCPKVFILIGDVYDTLRDRAIIIRMKRAEVPSRFLFETAKLDGGDLGTRMKELCEEYREAVMTSYTSHDGLEFLADRDEEIWMPLFAIASVFCPDRITDLQRIAVDMATEKTGDARRHTNLLGAEKDAEEEEYARRLIKDLLLVMGSDKSVFSTDALPKLKELPTGPWRVFRGEGLTAIDMANMLSRFGIAPKSISVGTRKKREVRRGYTRETLAKVVKGWETK
jgi:hypothetical protein